MITHIPHYPLYHCDNERLYQLSVHLPIDLDFDQWNYVPSASNQQCSLSRRHTWRLACLLLLQYPTLHCINKIRCQIEILISRLATFLDYCTRTLFELTQWARIAAGKHQNCAQNARNEQYSQHTERTLSPGLHQLIQCTTGLESQQSNIYLFCVRAGMLGMTSQ